MYNIRLESLAAVGYTILSTVAIVSLSFKNAHLIDFVAELLSIVGLVALALFHILLIQTGKDIKDDKKQLHMRQIAHCVLSVYFLLILSNISHKKFNSYDAFGMMAHIYLLYAVSNNVTQLPGVILLTMYFGMASVAQASSTSIVKDSDIPLLFGKMLMYVFFSLSFIKTWNSPK